jgi:hypothetical protein
VFEALDERTNLNDFPGLSEFLGQTLESLFQVNEYPLRPDLLLDNLLF